MQGQGPGPPVCGAVPSATQFPPGGPAVTGKPTAAAASCPVDAVQCIGERFAQLYYGLLAVHPSALRQFYLEGSQMSRSWCGAGITIGETPQSSTIHTGLTQIMDAIMESVGGQDPEHSNAPVVVTKVERVQSLALPDQSGIMSHITGIITFLQEGKMRRFSQSLLLEPSPEGPDLLYVRNDIVHYLDTLAPLGPGLPQFTPQTPMRPASAEAGGADASSPVASPPSSAAEASAQTPPAAAPAPAAGGDAPEDGEPEGPAGAEPALAGEAKPPAAAAAPKAGGGGGGGAASWAEIAAAAKAGGGAAPPAAPRRPAGAPVAKGLQALLSAAAPAAPPPGTPVLPPPPGGAARGGAGAPPALPGEALAGPDAAGGAAASGAGAPQAAPAGSAASPASQAQSPTPAAAAPSSPPSGGSGGATATTGGTTAGACAAQVGASSVEKAPVKLWVSQIPTEESRGRECRFNPVRGPEVRDALNQCLREHAPHIAGEVIEVDRKDERKPFAFAQLSDERTAKELVMLSKQKKVQLRGDRLILDLSNYNTARVETLYTGAAPTGRPQWYDDRGDRGGRGKGGKGGKGDPKSR